MVQIYRCIGKDHDPAILLIAVLACVIGIWLSISIGQSALALEGGRRRRRLCLAGIATGVTIWSTHLLGMLALQAGRDLDVSTTMLVASGCAAILISTCGWLVLRAGEIWRGYYGGLLLGLAIGTAHFLDMSSVRVAGLVLYDRGLVTLGVAVCLACSIVAGALIRRDAGRSRLFATCLYAFAILALHLVAMSAIQIVPTNDATPQTLDFGISGLALLVAASSVAIFLLGGAIVLHDLEVARITAHDRQLFRLSEEHHRFSIELNPQISWIADPQGSLTELSPQWTEMTGQSALEGIGHGWMAMVHPDDLPATLKIWDEAIASGSDAKADARYRLRQSDGTWRWFRARARVRRDREDRVFKWYGSLEDIHEQVNTELALRASEERYRLASLATNEVIWDATLGSERIEWSGAVEAILGYPGGSFGTSRSWWIDHLHPDDRGPAVGHIKEVLRSDADFWSQEFRFRRADGSYVDILTRGHVKRDCARNPVRMVGSLMDVTARKRTEAELRWAAHHDPLTRLPNRMLFAMRLDDALDRARRSNAGIGLVVIDVDRFKTLNDTLGHGAGDALLQEVSKRLSCAIPPDATVARLGGDEFAIIMPHFENADDRREMMRRLIVGMDDPFLYDGRHVDVSLSIGAARFPIDGEDSEALLKSADLALYAAKSQGPGHVCGFEVSMREAAENEKRMLVDARIALADEQIVPFYQPKICLSSGRIVGFEALLRWHHQERGVQLPSAIQAAFDDPRLAPELTNRMLTRILDDMMGWLDRGYDFGRIALNGSSEDFRRGDLTDRTLSQLARIGLPPEKLELEVTETVLLGKHAGVVEHALRTLRSEGVRIALDDFGTGYASLVHLKQFPVDVIKIDRSFISRLISEGQQDALIVGALIDLAKNLGIETVAEGVETRLQAFMLRRRGCDVGQGYFISQPMPAGHVGSFIDGWEPQRFLVDWNSRLVSLREI